MIREEEGRHVCAKQTIDYGGPNVGRKEKRRDPDINGCTKEEKRTN